MEAVGCGSPFPEDFSPWHDASIERYRPDGTKDWSLDVDFPGVVDGLALDSNGAIFMLRDGPILDLELRSARVWPPLLRLNPDGKSAPVPVRQWDDETQITAFLGTEAMPLRPSFSNGLKIKPWRAGQRCL